MRLLYLNEYFWPDSAGRLIKSLAHAWVAAGHEVTVLTMQPHYRSYRGRKRVARAETLDGIAIRRMPAVKLPSPPKLSILLNAFVFLLGAGFHGLRLGRPDVIISGTMPPIIGAFAGICLARLRKAKYVYHCQDVYPEAEAVLKRSTVGPDGREQRQGAAYRLLRWLDAWIMRHADIVVVLSEDMARTIRLRGVPEKRIAIINNYIKADEATLQPARVRAAANPTMKLLFAGNVGRFQRLDLLIRSLGSLPADVNVELLILGDGTAKAGLVNLTATLCPSRVRFHDPVPMSEVGQFIDDAHYCVVSLEAGMLDVAYPSKVMSYLARNAPLFCIVEPDSELGRLVVREGLGIVAPPGDAKRLQQALLDITAAPEAIAPRSAAAGRVGAELFSPAVIFGKWLALFSRLDAKAMVE